MSAAKLRTRLHRFLASDPVPDAPDVAAIVSAEVAELRRDLDKLRDELVALIERVRGELLQATAENQAIMRAAVDRQATATQIIETTMAAAIDRRTTAAANIAELKLVERLARVDDHLRRLEDSRRERSAT